MRVALVEPKPGKFDFHSGFKGEIEFDQYYLCDDPSIKKILKRDCTIKIDVDEYDWIILVGSDCLKYFTKSTSIMEYTGKCVEDKFLATINPSMMYFKPEMKKVWERSRDSILDFISGRKKNIVIDDSIAYGIQDKNKALQFIDKAMNYPKDYIGLDSETTALYPRNGYVQGLSISYDAQTGAYIDANCIDEQVERALQKLFSKKRVVFHNAKFDLAFFEYHFGFQFPDWEDTMLLHVLIDENPGTHGLKQLALKYTDLGDYERPLYDWIDKFCKSNGVKKADFNWEWIPFDVMYPYAATDALATIQIYEKFVLIKQNKKLKNVYEKLLLPGTRFLTDIQDNGVPFSMKRLVSSLDLMQHDIDEAVEKLYADPGVKRFSEIQGAPLNPNSPIQLRKLLFDFVGLNPTGIKTGTGADSTNAEVLEILAEQSPIPQLILDIRQKSKIKNTYLDKIIPQLDRDQRLRTNFNLHTTTSGRLSSSGKLNMQQIPRDNPIVKGCIQARPGYKIVAMDLTTAEMYVAAVLSKDKALQEVFRKGTDFHSTVAHTVFNLPCEIDEVKDLYAHDRQAAKAISFGILYGAGAHKISGEISKSSGTHFSLRQAQKVIDDYFRAFPQLKKWIDGNKDFIESNTYTYSFFGRKRRLPDAKAKDKGVRGHAIRSGLNFLVQSTASDINLLGAIDTHNEVKRRGLDAKIFALVHDSILAEVREDQVEEYSEIVKRYMQLDRGISISGTPIGCDFDVGDDYSFGKFEEKYG